MKLKKWSVELYNVKGQSTVLGDSIFLSSMIFNTLRRHSTLLGTRLCVNNFSLEDKLGVMNILFSVRLG